MRNRHLILLVSILLATFLVAGCGSHRALTKGETDQSNAISAKIAQAEGMTPKGAKICAPKELAAAKANLDSARHEATENWETAQPYFVTADKSADMVVAKTKACQPPIVKYSAAPAAIYPGTVLDPDVVFAKRAEGGDRSGCGSRGCERLQGGVPHRNHPVHVDRDRDRRDRFRDGNRHGEGPASSSSSGRSAGSGSRRRSQGGRGGNPSRQLRHEQIHHPAGGPRGAAEGGRFREEEPGRQIPRGGIYGLPRQRQTQPEAVREQSGGREEISRGRGHRSREDHLGGERGSRSRRGQQDEGRPVPEPESGNAEGKSKERIDVRSGFSGTAPPGVREDAVPCFFQPELPRFPPVRVLSHRRG